MLSTGTPPTPPPGWVSPGGSSPLPGGGPCPDPGGEQDPLGSSGLPPWGRGRGLSGPAAHPSPLSLTPASWLLTSVPGEGRPGPLEISGELCIFPAQPISLRNRIKFIDLSTHYLFHQLCGGRGGAGRGGRSGRGSFPALGPPVALTSARMGGGGRPGPDLRGAAGSRRGWRRPQGAPRRAGASWTFRAAGSNIFIRMRMGMLMGSRRPLRAPGSGGAKSAR